MPVTASAAARTLNPARRTEWVDRFPNAELWFMLKTLGIGAGGGNVARYRAVTARAAVTDIEARDQLIVACHKYWFEKLGSDTVTWGFGSERRCDG
jgi:hypothetical protein